MTKKDFELIARTISGLGHLGVQGYLAAAFAEALAAANPRFDRERFERAALQVPKEAH